MRPAALALLLAGPSVSLSLGACGDKGDDGGPLDADGDGFAEADDCDDRDAAVHPDAREVCDGLDNDCDGATDDEDEDVDASTGAELWPDADADGFGDAEAASAWACVAEDGWSRSSDDCDDADDRVHPGALEVCDDADADEDCNGVADDDDDGTDPSTMRAWVPDRDDDGHGDASDPGLLRCEDPSTAGDRFTTDNGDCDDGDASVHPSAREVCNDDVDNNCDGSPHPCTLNSTMSADRPDAALFGTGTQDTLGGSAVVADFNRDGQDDLMVGATGRGDDAVQGGAAYVVYGPISGSTEIPSTADVTITGDNWNASVGDALGVGDFNGDTLVDVVVGGYGSDDVRVSGRSNGAAFVLFGTATGVASASGTARSVATMSFWGDADGDDFSEGLAVADVNGDGFDDLLAGAPHYDTATTASDGAVYLFLGSATGWSGDWSASEAAAARWSGPDHGTDAHLGRALARAGDIDGDGTDDVLVGAPFADTDDSEDDNLGAALLQYGSTTGLSGDFAITDVDVWMTGTTEGGHMGAHLSAAGDVNGDGYDDFLVSEQYAEDPWSGVRVGRATLVSGAAVQHSGPLTATATFEGTDGYDAMGGGIGPAGDVNDDGIDDVAVSCPNVDAPARDAGAVYIYLGPVSGDRTGADADHSVSGPSAGDAALGRGSAVTGDLNGDGGLDLVVGAISDDSVRGGAGAVYLFWGGGF